VRSQLTEGTVDITWSKR